MTAIRVSRKRESWGFVTQATATADYRSIIETTLGRLPESTREARETVYRRARATLVAILRERQPPVSDDRLRDEISRLEEVIRQVEAQFQPTLALEPEAGTESNSVRSEPGRALLSEPHGAVSLVGRGLGRVGGVVGRRFETPDPTLPAILEFQRPSTTIVNAPIPRLARGVIWVVSSMVIALIAVCGLIRRPGRDGARDRRLSLAHNSRAAARDRDCAID
jgi:hypothetical protein